jgi:hypothetical protein
MMKILSIQDTRALLGGVSPDLFVDSVCKRLPVTAGPYAIPPDSGAKTSIAREVANLLFRGSEVFLYITGWMVWPSAEHFDLFDGYRRSLGEERQLKEAQVHVLSATDKSAFISLFAMSLYFVWDVQVFDAAGTILTTLSHDEWMEFRIQDEAITKHITEWASDFELQPLIQGSRIPERSQ